MLENVGLHLSKNMIPHSIVNTIGEPMYSFKKSTKMHFP
jgi:hypothetical protein